MVVSRAIHSPKVGNCWLLGELRSPSRLLRHFSSRGLSVNVTQPSVRRMRFELLLLAVVACHTTVALVIPSALGSWSASRGPSAMVSSRGNLQVFGSALHRQTQTASQKEQCFPLEASSISIDHEVELLDIDEALEKYGHFGRTSLIQYVIVSLVWTWEMLVIVAPVFVSALKFDNINHSVVGTFQLGASAVSWVGLTNSLFWGGVIAGVGVAGSFSDLYGRRTAILVSAAINAAFGMLGALAPDPTFYAFTRIMAGVGIGFGMTNAYVLATELVVPALRGRAGACLSWFSSLGLLLLALLAYCIPDWRMLLGVISILSATPLFLKRFILESPRWLLVQGRAQEAEHVLSQILYKVPTPLSLCTRYVMSSTGLNLGDSTRRAILSHAVLCDLPPFAAREDTADINGGNAHVYGSHSHAGIPGVNAGIQSVAPDTEAARGEVAQRFTPGTATKTRPENLADIVRSKVLSIRFAVMVVCWYSVGLVYYSYCFSVGDLPGSVYVNQALSAVCEIPLVPVQALLLSHFGRRGAVVGSAIACGTFSLIGFLSALPIFPLVLSPFLLASTLLIARLSASMCFMSLYLFSSELFPTSIRSSAMAGASLASRIGSFAAPLLLAAGVHAQALLGSTASSMSALVLLVSAGSMLFSAALAGFLLPETRDTALASTIADVDPSSLRSAGSGDAVSAHRHAT